MGFDFIPGVDDTRVGTQGIRVEKLGIKSDAKLFDTRKQKIPKKLLKKLGYGDKKDDIITGVIPGSDREVLNLYIKKAGYDGAIYEHSKGNTHTAIFDKKNVFDATPGIFKSVEDFYDQAKASTRFDVGVTKIKSAKMRIAQETSPFSSAVIREEFDPSLVEDKIAKELVEAGDARVRNLPVEEQYGVALKIAREQLGGARDKRLVSGLAAEVTNIKTTSDAFDPRFATSADEAIGTLTGTVNSQARKGAMIKAYLEAEGGFDNLPRELKELLIEEGPDAFIDRINQKYRSLIESELKASGKGDLSREFNEFMDTQLAIIDGVQDTNSLINNLKRLQSLKLSFSFIPNAFQ
ncbi:MAG: hypothetical protein AABW93_00325, partial [Nanoarchaeota archaeon]